MNNGAYTFVDNIFNFAHLAMTRNATKTTKTTKTLPEERDFVN